MESAGQRPPCHADRESSPGTNHIEELTFAGIKQSIRGQKRRLQYRKAGIGNRDGALDCRYDDRERLPVEVADGDGQRNQ